MLASPWKDAVVLLLILLLFFGPKRLPALSRSIGESIKEFKGGIAHNSESDEKSEISASAPEAPSSTSTSSQHTNA